LLVAAIVFTGAAPAARSQWEEAANLTASDGANGDWFGDFVAISQDAVVVGAPRDAADTGEPALADPTFDLGEPWQTAVVDLSAMAGANIRIRFGFRSADGSSSSSAGFYVDDVDVCDALQACALSEDFESGAGGFTVDNTFGDGNGLWHLTDRCWASQSGHTTPSALYYGVDDRCDYDSGPPAGPTEGVVTSPEISLAGMTPPIELAFNYLLETKRDSAMWDLARVEVSENGGPFTAVLDNDTGVAAGSAYVFRNDGGGWVQESKLTAPEPATGNLLGEAVSISGDTIVIGTTGDDHAGWESGAAHVFRHDGGVWLHEGKLTASDAAALQFFGLSVSVSSDTVVIGAPDVGSAYVFRRDDNGTPLIRGDDSWVEQAKLTASDAPGGHTFGWSVSVWGDTAVIGARDDGHAGTWSGSAYVFRRDDNGTPSIPDDDLWVEEDKLTASDATDHDWFGYSVSVSGDVAAIGAHMDDDPCPGGSLCGSAYVFQREDNGTPFDRSDDSWVQRSKLTASDAASDDYFGGSVSVSGDVVVVGANGHDDAGTWSGSAYVFEKPVGGWVNMTETAKLLASDAGSYDFFGHCAAVGDGKIVIGAPGSQSPWYGPGAAYVFVPSLGVPAVGEAVLVLLALMVVAVGTVVIRHRWGAQA